MPKTRLRSHILEPVEQVLLADVVAPVSPASPVQLFRFNLPSGGQYFLEATILGEMLAATTSRQLTFNLTSGHGMVSNLLTTVPRVAATTNVNQMISNAGVPVSAFFFTLFTAPINRGNIALAGRITLAAASDIMVTAVVAAEVCTVKAGSWIRATYLRPDV
jgi:hypothetical protein